MFKQNGWLKGFGMVALAAGLAIGGLAFSRAATTSAQAVWYDPTLGMYFNYQSSVSAYPVTFTSSTEPIVNTTGLTASVGFVAPTVSYAAVGVPSVFAAPTYSYVSPGGSYCAIGNDQIWVPAGASPASYGC